MNKNVFIKGVSKWFNYYCARHQLKIGQIDNDNIHFDALGIRYETHDEDFQIATARSEDNDYTCQLRHVYGKPAITINHGGDSITIIFAECDDDYYMCSAQIDVSNTSNYRKPLTEVAVIVEMIRQMGEEEPTKIFHKEYDSNDSER